MMRRFFQEPSPIPTPLDNDIFSLIIPVARTNLILNGSFELGITGITGIGGAGAIRSSTQQYHGAYSMIITSGGGGLNDGVYYDPITLTSGTLYAFSLKFLCLTAGIPYKMSFRSSGGTELAVARFRSTGRWAWQWVYFMPSSTTTYQLAFQKDNSPSTAFTWTDGWQCEALASAAETVSTYIDGDQQGLLPNQSPPAYVWNGTPFASTSSRSGLTRAGGMVVRLKDLGFRLLQVVGLTMSSVQNVGTEYARLDGGFDDYTRKPTTQFTLVGQIDGRTYQELRVNRALLASYLDRDLVGLDQRLALLYHLENCGNIASNEGRILCKYQGGFEGNSNSEVSETIPISFVNYMPMVQSDAEAGASLTVQTSVSNANGLVLRSPTGVYSVIGSGVSAGTAVNAAIRTLDGKYIIGGSFASFNGVANTAGIAQYDPATGVVSAMGTGVQGGGIVRRLLLAPNGDVVAVGTYLNMDGIAAADHVARWSGTAWSALGVYPGGNAPDGVFDATGNLYVTDGAGGHVYKWDGSAWTTSLTAGGGASAIAMARQPNGQPAVGLDTAVAIGGVTSTVAAFNGTSWVGQGALNDAVNDMTYDAAGRLWVADGLNVSRFNGTTWVTVTSSSSGSGFSITNAPDGSVFVGGSFLNLGGVTLSQGLAQIFNNTAVSQDVILNAAAVSVFAVRQLTDGTLVIGFNGSGTATAAGQTTVTNNGTAKAYPTLKITGPGSGTSRVYLIKNYTTGRAVYLNYTINAGETATLRFQPDNLSFVSNYVGNIANKILPGSAESDFFLQPGANVISFFADASSVTATLQWRPTFASLDGLTR